MFSWHNVCITLILLWLLELFWHGIPIVLVFLTFFLLPRWLLLGWVVEKMHNQFFVSIVYGSNNVVQRRYLWADMRAVQSVGGSNACVQMGDFNVFRKANEKLAGFDGRAAADLNICIEDVHVEDMPSKGF